MNVKSSPGVEEKPFVKPFVNKGTVLAHRKLSFVVSLNWRQVQTVLELLIVQSLSELLKSHQNLKVFNPLFHKSVQHVPSEGVGTTYRQKCWIF